MSLSCGIAVEKWLKIPSKRTGEDHTIIIISNNNNNIVTTNNCLSSNLKGESEGLLAAAQDQAINTRNYREEICDQQVESKCRMCSHHKETLDHIVSGREVVSKTEYIPRHNKAAAYLH